MFVQLIFLLLLLSAESFGYVVNSDSPSDAGNGWEHVFAQNPSSVIPLSHYDNKSYFIAVHSKATYMQAMQFCENLHMKLLSVRSDEENTKLHNFIRNTYLGKEYWTSGSKLLDGRTWIWMSYGVPVDYTNWAPNLSYDNKALCLQLRSEDDAVYWKHAYCGTSMFFICERYDTPESTMSTSIMNENGNPNTQVTRWMDLLDHVSPNIGLLEFGNKKYYFSSNFKANYMQAVQFCKIIKMELVTITSQEENDRIRKYIRDTGGADYWWTSGSKLLDGKIWIWLPRGTRVEYTNWLPGQPGDDKQYCLHLIHQRDKGLFWNDNYCSNQYNVICERSSTDSMWEDGGGINNVSPNRVISTTPTTDDDESETEFDDNEFYDTMRLTEPEFITYSYVEGKKYYLAVDLVATHSQAARFCEYHHMQLVAVPNRKESEMLKHLLTDSPVSGPYWIAGESRRGTWTWSTSGEKVSFVNWNRNRPSNIGSSKKCIEVDESAKWSDRSCVTRHHFICEEPRPLASLSKPAITQQCSAATPPVVKVYINNNVITEGDTHTVAEKFLSSEDVQVTSDGGYHVQVNNNIDSSAPETGITISRSRYEPPYVDPE